MIKKRIILILVAMISIIFTYFLINIFVITITVIQFLFIEAIALLFSYLQEYHKKKLLKM